MNEDSRGLIRHYKRRSYVPKSRDILYGRKHPKEKKQGVSCWNLHWSTPSVL